MFHTENLLRFIQQKTCNKMEFVFVYYISGFIIGFIIGRIRKK